MTAIRVLLVEADPEESALLKEALAEIEEKQYWQAWVRVDVTHAEFLAEALGLLGLDSFDVILLDLDLPDSDPLGSLAQVSAAAPLTPIVLLSGAANEALAARLIRDGVQDYLIREEVDCGPLARALRNAIARNRIRVALRGAAVADPLTGLWNRSGFFAIADHDTNLAQMLQRRLLVAIVEPGRLPEKVAARDRPMRELALIEIAGRLRSEIPDSGSVARLDDERFGLVLLEPPGENLSSMVEVLRNRLRIGNSHSEAARNVSLSLGATIFDPRHPASLDDLLNAANHDLTASTRQLATTAAAD